MAFEDTNIESKNVKVVFTDDEGRLLSGMATTFTNGVALITPDKGDSDTTRVAGKWLDYLEFKKLSNNLYNKAVKLAKEKVAQ